jgi:hypothetical protein
VLRSCADHRDQDERGAGAGGVVDQAGIARAVYRGGRDAAGAGEAVHGGDDGIRAAQGPGEADRVADIAAGHLDPGPGQVLCPGRVVGQHPHRQALAGQARDQPRTESAGAAGDDDHGRDPSAGTARAWTCWRTASSASASLACTGSR